MRHGLQVIGETHAVWSRAQSSPASPFAIATFRSYIAFFFIYLFSMEGNLLGPFSLLN